MLWIIIIGIVVYILYKFFSDREKMLNNVAKQGGIENKFEELINYMLSDPGANILEKSRDKVVISWKGNLISAKFTILQNFNKVNIIWISNVGAGKKWEFSDKMDQITMVKIMDKDIREIMDKYI